ncbi:MAG: TIGR01777 family oxidoreductase [Rickettsiaceae bacterium]|nr:TIGR01777 family oxidoreductase [Rickettsiaceae bacterium]
MRILISGGSGFLGSYLSRHFIEKNYEVSVLTRDETRAAKILDKKVRIITDLDDGNKFDVIINLAGESLNKKNWSKDLKQKFIQSRVNATKKIVEFANKSKKKPSLLISASAVGFYGHDYNNSFTEDSKPADQGFCNQLCTEWENEAKNIDSKIRLCIIRIGIVLAKDYGAFKEMVTPLKYGLGATLGNGMQWMSWIHITDFINAIDFLIENKKAEGVFNLCAPEPVRQTEMAGVLASKLGRPHILRLPNFLVELIFGEMGKVLLLEGAKVEPAKLQKLSFHFHYPELDSALNDLCSD